MDWLLNDGRPIWLQIKDQIAVGIVTGKYPPGSKLPSVRELAQQLTINPNTIQRAYRELEAAGWIATVAGKGCFVCGTPVETQPEKLALLNRFDETATALQILGVTRKELAERLLGGKYNA